MDKSIIRLPDLSKTHYDFSKSFIKSGKTSYSTKASFFPGGPKKIELARVNLDIDENNIIKQLTLIKTHTASMTVLNISFGENIDLKMLTQACQLISLCRKITTLKLSFLKNLKLKNDALASIGNAVIDLPSLDTLCLNFSGIDDISDFGLYGLSDYLGKIITLRHIELILNDCPDSKRNKNLTDIGLRNLARDLSYLPKLRTLCLDFGVVCKETGLNFHEKGLIAFMETLGGLSNLRELRLCFGRCSKMSDRVLVAFANSLNSLKDMHSLVLDLSYCKLITNIGLIALANSIAKNAKWTNLNLLFSYCNNLSDEGMIDFMRVIEQAQKLICFVLELEGCNGVGNETIRTLFPVLRSLTDLETINLNFGNLSDDCVSCIDEAVPELPKLKTLILNFMDCDKISWKGYHVLDALRFKGGYFDYVFLYQPKRTPLGLFQSYKAETQGIIPLFKLLLPHHRDSITKQKVDEANNFYF